ncbi:MAG: hypothetical protein EOO10_07175 [Chitinophagaceae bacterium]|nr:MAG: hypothetical protein EOO10_07175 [Chitinophagaceae bacterium]
MERFTKTINGIEFSFQVFSERMDEACRVTVDGQDFKMTVGENGSWQILQQVPSWIKRMEKELSTVIEKTFCQ